MHSKSIYYDFLLKKKKRKEKKSIYYSMDSAELMEAIYFQG